ncbi:U3 snoRNP protein [Metarhizium acridum]|uniref:U3 snoRNP protein n=1 Tax=Metarhizium acridum TaxID=92637 RepID=UPI001C6B8661|nr:U3 snoRNP protein [Metarhizium acridum]
MTNKADHWASDQESSESDLSSDADTGNPPTANKRAGIFEKDSDEEELERLVLGNKAGFRENLFKNGISNEADDDDGDIKMGDTDAGGLEDVDDADLFVLDTGAGRASVPLATAPKVEEGDRPAWEDSDDDRLVISLAGTNRLRKLRMTEADDLVSGLEYSRRLRQQFLRLNPAPAWAKQNAGRPPSKRRRRSSAASDSTSDSDGDSDSESSAQPLEEFLRDVKQLAGLGASKRRRLRPEVLDIQRTRDIPDKHRSPVECLSFHPEYPVKQVDVRRAEFLYPQGDKIFFGGRRRYFHQWDLPSGIVQKTTQITGHGLEHKTMERFKLSPCGRYMAIVASTKKGGGIINVVSVASTQWIAAARLSSRHGIADFVWWSTGNGMTILGRDGQVGEYSMESRAFVGIWHDDGCIGGIVISLGGHGGPLALGEDRWVAVGSNSGITNIYDRSALIASQQDEQLVVKERPTPTRTFEQLITPITVLTFSPDGQLLAFGSREKKDALRLVHLPSCTVYRNWPTEQTPLGRITCVAFGRESDLLAVGNDFWEN